MGIGPGTRVGPYEVTALLGEGGMGKVWRAHHTALKRDDALKVLPDAFAADPERLARFEREAQVLASLNHPNIARVYGLEAVDGGKALVMELVDGPTLADVIAGASKDAPLPAARRGGSLDPPGLPAARRGGSSDPPGLAIPLPGLPAARRGGSLDPPGLPAARRGGSSDPPGRAIPLDDALPIAKQIAEALDAAHEQGIVHRDLKPANIKVRPDGTVKVLDFGLAKLADAVGAGLQTGPDGILSQTPTITTPAMTIAGVILGTAAYMSPEQAKGRPADRRTDIWAFGVVLYEMLTGRRPFQGDDVTETIAAVVKEQPDLTLVPARVRQLLRRCLEKDPKKRLRDIGDAWALIEGEAEAGREVEATRSAVWLWPAVAAGFAILAGVALWAPWRAQPSEQPLVRLDVDLGRDVLGAVNDHASPPLIISPDGTRLVYLASSSGGPLALFTRRLDEAEARELPGTTGASGPGFSPDGQWIGFFADGKFNKISVEGGAVIPLADVGGFPGGASWGEDGTIIVSGVSRGIGAGGLGRISSGGGPPAKVTEANGDLGHVGPQFLPGGKAVLFVAYPELDADQARIEVVTLADGHRKTLVRGSTSPRYLPTSSGSGHLVYTNSGTLFAIPFDPNRLETRGTAIPVVDDVAYQDVSGSAHFDVSRSGTMVYRKGASAASAMAGVSTIQWRAPGDSRGNTKPLLDKPGRYMHLRISPDGTRLAMLVAEPGGPNVWVYDLQRDAMTRLTSGGGPYVGPIWHPGGRYIFFGSATKGMFWTRADGAGEPQPLAGANALQFPRSVSPDGGRLAIFEVGTGGRRQLWTLTLEEANGQIKAGKPERFLESRFDDESPMLSPDGRWLAYVSNATGNRQAFVRAFPDKGERWQISNNGTTHLVVWSANGRDLLYQSGDQIMAVGYTVKGDTFIADKPRVWLPNAGGTEWDLAPDGTRVAVVTPVAQPETATQDNEVVFLLNFFDELRRRVPVDR